MSVPRLPQQENWGHPRLGLGALLLVEAQGQTDAETSRRSESCLGIGESLVIGLCVPDVLVSVHRTWLGGGGNRWVGPEGQGWLDHCRERVEEGHRAQLDQQTGAGGKRPKKEGVKYSGQKQMNKEK
jgi:hypothetical protein